MNRLLKYTLSACSLALFFEACTMKKAEVDPAAKDDLSLAEKSDEAPIPTFADADKREAIAAPSAVEPRKKSLLDRLYPASPTSGTSQPAQVQAAPKDEKVKSLAGVARGDGQYGNAPLNAMGNAAPPAPSQASVGRLYAAPIGSNGSPKAAAKMAAPRERRAEYEGYQENDGAAYATQEPNRCAPYRPYVEPRPQPNTEEYAPVYENAFLDARTSPLSTFSIDVDGASYSNTRRFLQEGQLPPADAVRLEEFINYFDYDYPQPTGSDPFSITTEVATTPWNPATKLVHIGLQGRRTDAEKLPPSNLVFLIDVSGSMDTPERLPLLKNAFEMLIDQLRPQDRISMVVYAGAAGMVLPPTSGADKETIREALTHLEAGGSTAGGAGLMLAYRAAKQSFIPGGSNRVILATDGDFNLGTSSDEELVRLIEEKRKSGVFLSVLGFGTGNLKDTKMEQLADKGNGNYFYIDNINEARKVLVEKMAGTLFTIAKDVKLQIEFNPATVKSYRLVGYENRVLAAEDFNDDKKDAGELGSGANVTALYEVVPINPPRPAVDPLKYQAERNDGSHRRWNWGFGGNDAGGELLTVKFRYKQPNGSTSKLLTRTLANRDAAWQDASQNFRFSAAAAGFGMVLRNSQYRGNLDFDKVAVLGRGAKGRDLDGHRAEFLTLVETAKILTGGNQLGYRQYRE